MESPERKGRRHKVDKHTFKVGDRVVCIKSSGEQRVGAKGQYWGGRHPDGAQNMWGIKFDIDSLNIPGKDEDFYSFGWLGEDDPSDYMRHDTDFQVGDWVRYEGVAPHQTPRLEGQLGNIEKRGDYAGWAVRFTSGKLDNLVAENLVKTQPPQEEKKMDIKRKHVEHNMGVISHNVKPSVLHCERDSVEGFYQASTSTFYPASEWEPVEEWVKIEVRKSQWDNVCSGVGIFEAWSRDGEYRTVSWRPVK